MLNFPEQNNYYGGTGYNRYSKHQARDVDTVNNNNQEITNQFERTLPYKRRWERNSISSTSSFITENNSKSPSSDFEISNMI